MLYALDKYRTKADEMIRYDRERDRANQAYDRMDHTDWRLPETLGALWWVRPVPSMQPHDAISSGVRVLSALDERINWQPVADNTSTIDQYNEWERVLKWTMDRANKRVHGTIQRSVVRSALKYDEVVCQVLDLDWQIPEKKRFGGNTVREEAARRYGRFAAMIYHPNDVHVLYSTWMPEAILLCQERMAGEVYFEWGEKAAGLLVDGAVKMDERVTYYDYSDYESRVIWTEPKSGGNEVEILRVENKLPFLPWVARVGGDVMEHDPEHRRNPLLYPIYTSDAWETVNIVNSLLTSEVIARAAAPRALESGPVEDSSTITDYGDINQTVKVTPGNVWQPLPPPVIDSALVEIKERIAREMTQSTLSDILQGGSLPSGTSFAALNLATQTAIGALKPYKELAERALGDIYSLFLLWAHYTQKDIDGYGMSTRDRGTQYSIPWDAIDPNNIYLNIELAPDVPLDRQARANTAMMLVQAGIYSKKRALEDMGVTDPEKEMEDVYAEQYEQFILQQDLQNMALENQMRIQAAMQPPPEEEAMGMEGMPPEMMGMEGMGPMMGLEAYENEMGGAPQGMGWNPAMGGMPPALAAPGATREGVKNTDQYGSEVVA